MLQNQILHLQNFKKMYSKSGFKKWDIKMQNNLADSS